MKTNLILLPPSVVRETNHNDVLIGKWLAPTYGQTRQSFEIDKVLPYHWDDREKLRQDISEIKETIGTLIPILSDTLNLRHGRDFPINYWELVIGEWLYLFCQITYDRLSLIESARKIYGDIELSDNSLSENLIPVSTADFQEEADKSHFWNANFIREINTIIQREGRVNPRISRTIQWTESKKPEIKTLINLTKRIARFVFLKLSKPSESSILTATYLSKINLFQLCIRTRGFPFLELGRLNRWSEGNNPEDFCFSFPGSKKTDFEIVLESLIPLYLPAIYLEQYEVHEPRALNEYGNYVPKYIVTANSHYGNEEWKIWAATSRTKGSKIVILQHGGHYGLNKFSLIQDYEVLISDKFLSWGWKVHGDDRIKPAPGCKLIKKPTKGEKNNLLIITAESSLYANWLGSFPVGPQILETLPATIELINSLSSQVRTKLRVRPYPTNFGLNQEQTISQVIGKSRVSNSSTPFQRELGAARVVVCMYNSTTFIEAMRNDTPTLLLLNLKFWETNPEYSELIREMKSLGIIHESSNECAEFLNREFKQIEIWWESHKVRKIREEFLAEFGFIGHNPVKGLAVAILG